MIIKTQKEKINFDQNLNFIKEFDDGHILDRLYIYWDITTKCNFNCSYCYARNEYPNEEWNQSQKFINQKLIINALSKAKLPIYLGFHGGEPTVDKNFLELIQIALEKLSQNSMIYIATNGSTNVFEKIYRNNLFQENKNRLRFLFSCHFEHKEKYGNNFEFFFKNIKFMNDCGFKTKANILLLPDKKYWNDTKFVFEECLKLCKTHPHFIYYIDSNEEILYNYSPEFYSFFKDFLKSQCSYIFETENNYVEIKDYELFKYKLYNFKGWKCYNNNYEIKLNGDLFHICSRKKINLLKNPLALAKIDKINYIKCPFESCLSDGVLKCLKTKY